MGYYSRFEISVSDKSQVEAVKLKVEQVSDYEFYEPGEADCDFTSDDTYKWYDHKEHLTLVSKSFPELTITLNREGEEPGDLERTEYKDGVMKKFKTVITYEPV